MVTKILATAKRDPRIVKTAMSSRFDRYNREPPQLVRKADVTGQSYIEQARRTRQMLRDMTPEQVKQVIEFHRDSNFFKAIALAKREGKLIVPNFVHDRILTETTDKGYLRQNYWVCTGTLIIYEAPDIPFGEQVIYTDKNPFFKPNLSVTFDTTLRFREKANCALVVEHPDFDILDLGNNRFELRLVEGANIHLIERFPKQNGWYLPNAETLVPQGESIAKSDEARLLFRSHRAHICLLARGPIIHEHNQGVRAESFLTGMSGSGVALMPLTEKSDSK